MRSVVHFYLPGALDPEHPGYLQDADHSGTFLPSSDRFLSLQARQLWLFSTLATEGVSRDATLSAARSGYQSVRRFRDDARGGYHSKISADGQIVDRRKELCLNGFALYALAAYHRATAESRPLDEARHLFDTLEAHSHDRQFGGYLELFEADWTPIADRSVRGYWAYGDAKTHNGHLHYLETLAELYRVWPDELVARRLGELIAINLWAMKHPRVSTTVLLWTRDWRMTAVPRNRLSSYGHDLEGVWLTLDAARALGWSSNSLRGWAVAMCSYALRHGYDTRHGGFYREGPIGRRADDRSKEWWIQAEALVAMLELFRMTSDPIYYGVFASTLDFIERHQIAPGGGWWSIRSENGSPHARGTLGSEYQDGYHTGRALLRCARMLEDLSA
jgi:mannobiose 2-epimerase